MSKAVRAWLPGQALSRSSIEPAIHAVVNSWADSWFGEECQIRVGAALSHGDGDGIERIGGGAIGIDVHGNALIALGAHCGGLEPDRLTTACDRALCKSVGLSSLTDVHARLTDIAGTHGHGRTGTADSDNQRAKRHRLHVGAIGASWSFVIDAGESAVIALLKAQCRPTFPSPAIARGALADALSRQSVTLGAKVGAARVPIAAARDLCIGDVLILDRRTHQAMPLTIDGATIDSGSAHHKTDGDRIALEIDQPLVALALR